jgi:hypothetical protein
MNLSNFENLEKFKKEFKKHSLSFPRKYANVKNIVNSTGDDLEQVRNCKYSFSLTKDENVNYSFFVPTGGKDCYDLDHVGLGTSESYELHSAFDDNKVFFSNRIYYSHNVFYSDDVYNSENIFACAGLRKKSYCIFNKQYGKDEYEELVNKIIKHMNDIPYLDNKGRVYKYGEFIPIEIIPFAYNDSVVQEYFPLNKELATSQGYKWKEKEEKNYNIDIKNKDIPDNIKNVTNSILGKVIECTHKGKCTEQCTEAFKIIPEELQFYKRMNLPIPRLCPNCRHYERLSQRNPLKLWHRKCMKEGCTNEFETSYAPKRPEIIYCERCYQQEVY